MLISKRKKINFKLRFFFSFVTSHIGAHKERLAFPNALSHFFGKVCKYTFVSWAAMSSLEYDICSIYAFGENSVMNQLPYDFIGIILDCNLKIKVVHENGHRIVYLTRCAYVKSRVRNVQWNPNNGTRYISILLLFHRGVICELLS